MFCVKSVINTPILLVGVFMLSAVCEGASYYNYDDSRTQDLRCMISDVQHEVENHEAEIKTFSEKFESLQTALESLREQLNDNKKNQKQALKASSHDVDSRILNLDHLVKAMNHELKQLKTQVHEFHTDYSKHITELQKASQIQHDNIHHLQKALKTLTDFLQTTTDNPQVKTYRVKAGDTLDKIAKANSTTIEAIKTLNKLSNDKIISGQKLLIPAQQ